MTLQSATIIMAADKDANDISNENPVVEGLKTFDAEDVITSAAAMSVAVSIENNVIPLSAQTKSDESKEYAQWQFKKGEDASIETVSVPHTWNKEGFNS